MCDHAYPRVKMAVVSDEARIRELAEAIRVKCAAIRPSASTPTTTNSVQVCRETPKCARTSVLYRLHL